MNVKTPNKGKNLLDPLTFDENANNYVFLETLKWLKKLGFHEVRFR